jgi:DNA invertase Pin-like site-specific DNA recombinase
MKILVTSTTAVVTRPSRPESLLRQMAQQCGYEIVQEYLDTISGSKAKRPGLDRLLADARRHRFDVVLVAAFDRMARSTRHCLELLDELNHLSIEFISFRENIDTGGPLGRAMIVIVGAIAELERSLIHQVRRTTGPLCHYKTPRIQLSNFAAKTEGL